MALFKCQGDIVVRKDIELLTNTGWVNWDATNYIEVEKTFDKDITPTEVELYVKSEISNGGSGPGTWAGSVTKFYLHEKSSNTWIEYGSVDVTASYGVPTRQKTITLDISQQTKGKKYDKMKISVGHGSSDCTSRKTGRATIKEYKR